MEWRNWKYIITVILNEDWTYKDKSEIIDEMLMESIMKRIVFIGEGRIKQPLTHFLPFHSKSFFENEWFDEKKRSEELGCPSERFNKRKIIFLLVVGFARQDKQHQPIHHQSLSPHQPN